MKGSVLRFVLDARGHEMAHMYVSVCLQEVLPT